MALAPRRRMAALLRRVLRQPQPSTVLDVDVLVGEFARARFPRRLPLKCLPSWRGASALVIDATWAVQPLIDDLLSLAEETGRVSGAAVPVYLRKPDGAWIRRLHRQESLRSRWVPVGTREAAKARHILLAGDGGLLTADPATLACWRALSQQVAAAGGRLTCLVPTTARLEAPHLAGPVRCVRWDRGTRLVPARLQEHADAAPHARGDAAAAPAARLVAAMAMAVRVEPDLLRALRVLLDLTIDEELAAWHHEDVDRCVLGAQVRIDRAAHWREVLRAEPLDLRRAIATLVRHHHARLSPFILMEEAAFAADLAGETADPARQFWERAAQTVRERPASAAAQAVARYIGRAATRAHPPVWSTVPALAQAWLAAHRDAVRSGLALPPGMPLALVHRELGRHAAMPGARHLWLVLDRDRMLLQEGPARVGQSPLAGIEATDAVLLQSDSRSTRWIPLDELPKPLVDVRHGGSWSVRTASESLTFAPLRRPPWARGWGRDREGLFVLAPRLVAEDVVLRVEGGVEMSSSAPASSGMLAPPIRVHPNLEIGVDEGYGVHADLACEGIVVRFRYVAPALPVDSGFWMSETAVTQALWARVTGWRPNDDALDDLPVHSIDEFDLDVFIEGMEAFLPPEVIADLPGEAQWQRAFELGNPGAAAAPATMQEGGLFFDERIEARAPSNAWLRPNDIGIRGMHGYAWEWCRDTLETPEGTPTRPEVRTAPGTQLRIVPIRALRGGTLGAESRMLSSTAFHERDHKHRLLGLRVVLVAREAGDLAPGETEASQANAATRGVLTRRRPGATGT
jgi:hypothetical protein